MSHHEEDDRRGCLRSTDFRRERHDAIGLASHQSARGGVVQGKGRDGDLVKPPESHLTATADSPLTTDAIDDDIPRGRIEDIKESPKGDDGEEPVSGMLQSCPDFLEVELGHHDDQHQETEDEEAVLVFLFHSGFCCS